MNAINKIISKSVLMLCLLLFAGLFLMGFAVTAASRADFLTDEHLILRYDSPVWNLIGLICAALVLGGIYWLVNRYLNERNYRILLAVGSIGALFYSIYWVYSAKTSPVGDQIIVCWFADAFNDGDYTGLLRGNYVSLYRHQLGIITFLRLLFKVFGETKYQALQYLNALEVAGTVFFGAKYAEEISKDKRVGMMAMLLELGCVPLFIYTSYVYGEITSIFCSVCALYLFTRTIYIFRWKTVVLTGIILGFGVWVRRNTLIVLIAMILFLIYRFIIKPGTRWMIWAAVLLAGTMIFQIGTNLLYRAYTPEDAKKGVPTIARIALGVNDTNGYAGMYDGTLERLIAENDNDPDGIKADAIQILEDFRETCKQNPRYALDFYWRKINLQWSAPMYQALEMNNYIDGEQGKWAAMFYSGQLGKIALEYMNIYQLAGYLLLTILLVCAIKRKEALDNYVGIIAIFGGFCFTVIGENKARYAFPYLVMMIPYMAVGWRKIWWLQKKNWQRM